MSLFLSQEKMWDMPLGGTSKEKQIPHWFGNIAFVIVGGIFKLLFRYRVDGRENLRAFNRKSGVVVICNHTSYLDVAFIYLSARLKQWIRLMGRESLFSVAHGLVGQIFSRVGAFPVKRDTSDRVALKRAIRDLKSNEAVCILPEGTRRGKGSLTPTIHAGCAFIAKMGHAPILPMTVRNAENVKQKGQRFRFPKVTIEFGDPILVSDFDFLPKEERLEGCAWYAMREVFALSKGKPANEVDMVELFPDNRDFSDVFAAHGVPRHSSAELVQHREDKEPASTSDSSKDPRPIDGVKAGSQD